MPVYRVKIYQHTKYQDLVVGRKAILAPQLSNCDKATVIYVVVPPGGATDPHIHKASDEIIYVVSGEGEFIEEAHGGRSTHQGRARHGFTR